MTVFFLAVGLEIKRELLVGELSSFRKASLPFVAACGGMLVPVIVYSLFGRSGYSGNARYGYTDGYGYCFFIGCTQSAG